MMASIDKDQGSTDEIDENQGISCTLDMFKEYDDIVGMIKNISEDSQKAKKSEKRFEDFKTIIDKYQEQPHLLDPYLEKMLSLLVDQIRSPDATKDELSLSYKYLWLIIKVRGYKCVVKKMPHEVRDLLPVLKLLEDQGDGDDFQGSYVLLMWLSIILYMPFNMKKFDVSAQNAESKEEETVIGRIVLLIKKYLEAPHSSREIAAYLGSRFFTRPDLIEEYLPKFIDYCFEVLKRDEMETRLALFHKMGALRSLGQIFKNGKREELLPYAEPVLKKLSTSGMLQREDTFLQKYAIKLIQRIGLTCLKPRIASWRYQRGSRSLAINVVDGKRQKMDEVLADDSDESVHPLIEDVIDVLLEGIKNKDTIVRWSAAKGIGRVTSRLPRDLADDVVGAILDLFNSLDSHRAWHGGCLALAELARRGLFLPERFSEVLPILEKALVYDELRGQSSIGSNIRDAACYLSWAFARAYNPEQLAPYVQKIATGLLIVSLFDREIPCRRAGSAAFQEHVGRQGTFPHGIEILTAVDYFAVGNRSNAFLALSVHVGQYNTYTIALIDHLVDRKIGHWDTAVRNLTGQALANLTSFEPCYIAETVLPSVIRSCTSSSLILRHGSVVATGHMILALSNVAKTQGNPTDFYLTPDIIDAVCQVVFVLEEKGLYKGMGGEYMKQATTVMIGKCALAAFPIPARRDVLDKWHVILEDCLIYVDEILRQEALDAIAPLWNQYYIEEKEWQKSLVQRYIGRLGSSVENQEMGFTAGLGAMPLEFMKGQLKKIIVALVKVVEITPHTLSFAKARKESINSIMKVVETVGIDPNGSEEDTINPDNIQRIYECLLKALTDYTMDRRGDIGAWVREMSVQALTDITKAICEKDPRMIDDVTAHKIVENLCQQAVERIDRTRKIAGSALQTFLYKINLTNIPRLTELKEIFDEEWCTDCNWSSESITFDKFVRVLDLSEYRTQTLLGLFYSLGGTSANLSRYTCTAIQTYLNDRMESPELLKDFMSSVLALFKTHQKVDRITLPIIKSLVEILSSCNALDEIFETDPNILKELVGAMRIECSKSTDFYKLSAAVTVFCELLRIKSSCSKVILTQLSIFLGYQYPKVRAITATSLLMALQEYEYGSVHGISHESLEQTCLILEDTPWMDSIENAREQRNKVCELMNIPSPMLKPKIKK